MAKFQKGQSGNPKGRPKGARDKNREYIQDWVLSVIGSNSLELLERFKKLRAKEQWRIVVSLLPFAIPRQTEAKVNADVDLSLLTDEQINYLIKEITNGIDDY